ncbi:MAG: hypothetical protein JOY90_01925 [Bradyrhizobium sp.]|uniref:hypothetical protein n=1 Tax=Bradyrhizobium sp. TaxID=376 RepID=UPI001DBDF52E|nr:hypothetical protein [Bradyrhizobium sp.]MBV9559212.1 hypothetical protein [Bradyrhizobium sp.]
MTEEIIAIVRCANIRRYQRLLRTQLTDLERAYLEKRLAEEKASLQQIAPLTWRALLRDQDQPVEARRPQGQTVIVSLAKSSGSSSPGTVRVR